MNTTLHRPSHVIAEQITAFLKSLPEKWYRPPEGDLAAASQAAAWAKQRNALHDELLEAVIKENAPTEEAVVKLLVTILHRICDGNMATIAALTSRAIDTFQAERAERLSATCSSTGTLCGGKAMRMETQVILNGVKTTFLGDQVSYGQIASKAGYAPSSTPSITYTDSNMRCILLPGCNLRPNAGMVINCIHTGNA